MSYQITTGSELKAWVYEIMRREGFFTVKSFCASKGLCDTNLGRKFKSKKLRFGVAEELLDVIGHPHDGWVYVESVSAFDLSVSNAIVKIIDDCLNDDNFTVVKATVAMTRVKLLVEGMGN